MLGFLVPLPGARGTTCSFDFLHALIFGRHRSIHSGHTLQTSQDHEHDDGQEGREDGAHQVVAAAVLADVHQLGDGPADHIHPRDGGREEETRGDGGGKSACCCGYNSGHFTLSGEKRSTGS